VRRTLILLLTLSLLVGGCTYPKTGRFAIPQLVINAGSAERAIDSVVLSETKAQAFATSCPSNVVASLGNTFVCTYVTNQDVAYRATVRVTRVHGDQVAFSIALARG
jgi:hypothetical protein